MIERLASCRPAESNLDVFGRDGNLWRARPATNPKVIMSACASCRLGLSSMDVLTSIPLSMWKPAKHGIFDEKFDMTVLNR